MSETVHATAVLVGADGVLIRGDSGAGKSALALALIERGARLIADDRVHAFGLPRPPRRDRRPRRSPGRSSFAAAASSQVPHERGGVIRLVADIVSEEGLERMPEPHQLSATICSESRFPASRFRLRPTGPCCSSRRRLKRCRSHRDMGLRTAQV